MNTKKSTALLKAFANRHRLQILHLLAEAPNGLNVSAINEKVRISQPALSQQLARLLAADLVLVKRSSRERIYQVASPIVDKVLAVVREA